MAMLGATLPVGNLSTVHCHGLRDLALDWNDLYASVAEQETMMGKGRNMPSDDELQVLRLAFLQALDSGTNRIKTEDLRAKAEEIGISAEQLLIVVARLDAQGRIRGNTTLAGTIPAFEIPWHALETQFQHGWPNYDLLKQRVTDQVKGIPANGRKQFEYLPDAPKLALDTILHSLETQGRLKMQESWGAAPWISDVSPLLRD